MSPAAFDTDRPHVDFTDADGTPRRIVCDWLVGADGSRSVCRNAIPEAERQRFSLEYPFAWFGILCEAPPSAPVAHLTPRRSERGFALISQRSDTVQRMYFQCSPDEDASAWSDDRIFAELQARVDGPDGFELTTGPVFERTVLPFRSYVSEPMRLRSPAARGRCRPHRAADGREGPQPGAPGRPRALRSAARRCAVR